MPKQYQLSALFLAASLAFAGSAQAHDGKKVTGLHMPESTFQAADGRVFVSEIGEFGKAGDGQIRVLNEDGTSAVFATGLDDPKGLAVSNGYIYVADNPSIKRIAADGSVSVLADASAFPVPPQFLNDLVADDQGNLYVSDSGDLKGSGGVIYRVSADGKVDKVVDGSDPAVKAPNGLLLDSSGQVLFFVDFFTGKLNAVDLASKQVTELAKGFGGGDGLVYHKNGNFYLSDWAGGKVFSLNKGQVTVIKEGLQSAADIAISNDGQFLLVPDMKAGELLFLPIHSH